MRMIRKALTFTTLFLMFVSSNLKASDNNLQIKLLPAVSTSAQVVSLSDIAVINSEDSAQVKELGMLEITQAPRIGYISVVKREEVQRALKNKIFEHAKIDWSGAKQTSIRARGQEYPFSKIADIAQEYLFNQLSKDYRKVKVTPRDLKKNINIPVSNLDLKPRMNSMYLSKKMSVWVDVYSDNKFYRSVPVWLNVDVIEPVYIAKVELQGKNTIVSDYFIQKEMNVAEISGQHLSVDTFTKPLLLLNTVNKGEVLLTRNTMPVPAVIGGKKIDLEVVEGTVKVRLQGIAQQNAEIGDVLRVRIMNGQELIKAIVIAKQLARVI